MQDLFRSARENLAHFWGYDDFRSGQDEAVISILSKQHTLVLFPTGGGKSLCYQVPATVLDGLTLVISPLVALMQDQVQQLSERDISATFINSTLPNYEVEQRLVNARNGMYKLLYCAPERLGSMLFQAELEHLNIDLVAIDEAHCISEWGHDFRPSYRHIKSNLEVIFEDTRWIALTATATPEVQEDILTNLDFKKPTIVSRAFARPNLVWWVFETANKKEKLFESVKKASQKGDGLIYGGTRKNCEYWAARLTGKGLDTEPYHAGLHSELRKQIQERWITGETPLVVATNAFGMGIDKPDCRYVIHEEMPFSIEAYYQEAGRVGRDGQKSFPILFYRDSDYIKVRSRIQENYPTKKELQRVYTALGDALGLAVGSKMQDMVGYELSKIKTRCGLSRSICLASLRLMEQFGVIATQAGMPPMVGVQFTLSQEMMNVFKQRCQNPEKAEFVDRLERLFGHHAYNDMVELEEEAVLNKFNISRNVFIKGLNVLMQNDYVLVFKIYPERNLIRLLSARSRQIPIDLKDVETYRENLLRKVDLMNGYARTKMCREVYLRNYFGDTNAEACGKCDNCIHHRKESFSLHSSDIRKGYTFLVDEGKNLSLLKQEKGWSTQKIQAIAQYLVNEGKIVSDPNKESGYFLSNNGGSSSE